MTIDFASTALLVVDMQYGDAHREYGLLKDKRAAGLIDEVERYATRLDTLVVPNIQRLLGAFRANGGEVIFVRIQSLTMDGRDRGAQHRERGIHFPPGSKEGEILQAIAPLADEIVLSKTCGSAIRGTNLEYLLRSMGRETLAVCGVVTGSCVQATTCDAAARGFDAVVIEDATATWSDDMQREALETMCARGARVVCTHALMAE